LDLSLISSQRGLVTNSFILQLKKAMRCDATSESTMTEGLHALTTKEWEFEGHRRVCLNDMVIMN